MKFSITQDDKNISFNRHLYELMGFLIHQAYSCTLFSSSIYKMIHECHQYFQKGTIFLKLRELFFQSQSYSKLDLLPCLLSMFHYAFLEQIQSDE